MANLTYMQNGQEVTMTDDEQTAFLAQQAIDDAAMSIINTASEIKLALIESDKTMLRIQEAISLGLTTATTADVVAWVNYRRTLRAGTLASKPAYPENT